MPRSSPATRSPRTPPTTRCTTTLLTPTPAPKPPWWFIRIPKAASDTLPTRGQITVEGTINNTPFQATLDPDGQAGHWFKVTPTLRKAIAAQPGDTLTLTFTPVTQEPEPTLPAALRDALRSAPPKARETWNDITPAARRDFVFWINSAKQQSTRDRRATTACDMLAKGKRRPCCFDKSGIFSNSLTCPTAAPPDQS